MVAWIKGLIEPASTWLLIPIRPPEGTQIFPNVLRSILQESLASHWIKTKVCRLPNAFDLTQHSFNLINWIETFLKCFGLFDISIRGKRPWVFVELMRPVPQSATFKQNNQIIKATLCRVHCSYWRWPLQTLPTKYKFKIVKGKLSPRDTSKAQGQQGSEVKARVRCSGSIRQWAIHCANAKHTI